MGKEKFTLSPSQDDLAVPKRIKPSSLREDGGYKNPLQTQENIPEDQVTENSTNALKFSSFPSTDGGAEHPSVSYSPQNAEVKILEPKVKSGHQRVSRLNDTTVSPQSQCDCKASSNTYPPLEEYEERRCCPRILGGWRSSSKAKRRTVKVTAFASVFVLLTVLGFVAYAKRGYIQRLLGINVRTVCKSAACIKTAGDVLSKMDLGASPCHDFYAFSCGGWRGRFPPPPSRGIWNQYGVVYERTLYKIKGLLEAEPRKDETRPFKLARKMYKACINQGRWNEVGVMPLLKTLDDFGGWPMITPTWTEEDFDWLKVFAFMRKYYGVTRIISVLIGQDDKDPARKVLYLDQGWVVDEPSITASNDTSARERVTEWMTNVALTLLRGKPKNNTTHPTPTDAPDGGANSTGTALPESPEAPQHSEYLLNDGSDQDPQRFQGNVGDFSFRTDGKSRISEGRRRSRRRKRQAASDSNLRLGRDIDDVWNFYVELAKVMHPDPSKLSDEERYNPMTIREFMNLSRQTEGNINWGQFLAILFSDSPTEITYDTPLIVVQPNFFRLLPDLIERTSKRILANAILFFLVVEMGNEVSPYFSSFYERKLTRELYSSYIGRHVIRPWFDCSNKLSYYMNLVVTRMYLGNDKEANLQEANHIKEIVEYFKEELVSVFNSSSWMDDQTRKAATEKVNKLEALVGFSEKLTEDIMIEAIYLHFPEMSETNHYENIVRAKTYYSLSSLCCLEDEVSDRERWHILFLETNAIYSMQQNSIQIPLGILQAPFYRKDAALPVFFGSTGSLIGHEMFHGFDKSGSTRNWNGTLTTWWTNKTQEKYNKDMECYEDLYSSLPLLEEIRDQHGNIVKVDGGRTVEENFADNEGLSLSWNVYKKLQGNVDQTLAGLENYSSDQLFFISYAQMWCSNFDHESLVEDLKYGHHTPEPFRVRGLVRNNPHFAQVFNCSAHAPMTSPGKCVVW